MAMSGRADSRDELDALRSDDRLRPPRRWNSIGFVLPSHPVLTPASCNLRRVGPALAKLSDEAGRALPLSALLERRRRARCFSGSESSVTIVLGCLFPRSRRRRHFGDDLGWHLNLGFFFLIWRPVNFRLLRRSGRILDDDGFSGRPARRLGHGIGLVSLRMPCTVWADDRDRAASPAACPAGSSSIWVECGCRRSPRAFRLRT